ncbi:protein phosphatase 2C domain-containing protein [Chryseobacterium sp. MA9]|uniref:protein phosphatase 2C domain-containing protein n=1 Tax=Chryseobacterium sp. MA9 TaxID=2966625 RepID=UPI0021066F6E|nr:protein phosphatase 2C domain-containing protein [Chryseobacterium sp. MA9]UTX48253.1 protein phosphatase 2C domain-containing protein [Chryseobacterium sp. MA9]
MKLYSALQIGDYHINHCEDYLLIKKVDSDKIVCAVMDGCSTAMDSHFTSALFGKLLRKVIIEKGYKSLYDKNIQRSLDEDLKEIVEGLFKELVFSKNYMMLDEKELLTTLIILVYNKAKDEGIILAIGDGVICINGKITEFDRNNKPDYLAYHLHENFEDWYSHQSQKIIFNDLNDISIATDGILSFSKIKKTDSDEMINFAEYLMIDRQNSDTEEMLNRKLKQLEHQYGVKPTDDLAIVRIIK